MIDNQTSELVHRNAELCQDMLRHAHLVTGDTTEQIGAMLTAATVLIEREVGRALAPSLLMAIIQPTLEDWCTPAPGERPQ